MNFVKILSLVILIIMLTACSQVSKTDAAMNAERYDQALKTGNATFCDIMTGAFTHYGGDYIEMRDKNLCYKWVGAQVGDPDICDKIDDNAQGDARDQCYQMAANTAKDPMTCSRVISQHWKDVCYKGASIAAGYEAGCDEIQDEADRKGCIYNVAPVSANALACNKLGSDRSNLVDCYQNVAEKTHNTSICFLPVDYQESYKTSCIHRIASATQNPLVCDLLENEAFVNLCYKNTATVLKNVSVCDQVYTQDLTGKKYCYVEVAVGNNNLSFCDLLDEQFGSRSDCYTNFAIFTHNASVCGMIDPVYGRPDECINQLNI